MRAVTFGTALLLAGIVHGQQPPPLGIFLAFDTNPAETVAERVKEETNKILSTAGVLPVWRSLRAANGSEPFTKVVVVRFRGTCDGLSQSGDEMAPYGRVPSRLGTTQLSGGRVTPWVDVWCDGIRGGLGEISPARRVNAFARAAAQVLAHELYHVLANSTGHARKGLAKPIVEWNELLGGALHFGNSEREALRHSLR